MGAHRVSGAKMNFTEFLTTVHELEMYKLFQVCDENNKKDKRKSRVNLGYELHELV